MTEIYGVNAQTYRHLPPEDQAAIRESWQARQAPAAEPAPVEAPVLPSPDPSTAQTPQEAVNAIHALPVPDLSDIPPGMPSYAQQSIYEGRAQTFNQTRAEAAQAALDRLAPQRSDFDGLNGATANHEYQQSVQAWNSNPYVQELQRIVSEANGDPNSIPAYLTDTAPTADTQQIPLPQMRGALALLGVDIPENATPQQIADGYAILATVPDDLLGPLINPGSQVSFTTGAGGLGTPGPVRVGGGVEVEGQVELSDVQTGVNFQQTQQFRMVAQTTVEGHVEWGKTPLQRIYGWADRLGALPDSARQLVNNSPILSRVTRGLPLPVSGSYSQFSGARLTYEAVVTPEQGAMLDRGELEGAPNPLDPLNMAPGTSVLIRGQELEGTTFELNYKAFTVGGTTTELSGQGFGVTRGEGSIVEVYSGPVDTVENNAFFGLGRQGMLAVGIGSDLRMETREMQIARIDLSTAEGQAVYQNFISTGQVPQWSPPGVQQSGTTEVFSHEYASFIGLQVGGLEIGGSSDANGTITRTTWADGTVEYSNTYTSVGGVTTDVRYQLDASGNPDYDNATWTVVRANLDPTLANYLESAYDPSRANQFPENAQHTQQVFTTDELMALRDRARDYVVQVQGQEKLDNLDSGVETPWWSSQEEALAVADTPEEVFAVLSNDFHGGAVIESLLGMSFDGNTMPGQFRMIDAG